MLKFIIAASLLLASQLAWGETAVSGRLDDVSFNDQIVVVDGVQYEVITESTRVLYGGQNVGEEGLTPGDTVQLILGDAPRRGGKVELVAVIIIRGQKSGLES